MSGTADGASSPEEYFRAVEEVFIGLRGAPLLLSPADWQTAKGWYEEGIPVELASRVMAEVFERLRERDPERRIHSLRYCAPAVEAAWREVRDLGAAEGRLEPEPIDVPARLAQLADRLPEGLPSRASIAGAIRALDGEAEAVEDALHAIERDAVSAALQTLDDDARTEIDGRVERALSRARSRVAAEELTELETRLRREFARQSLGLPTLSLFAGDLSAD